MQKSCLNCSHFLNCEEGDDSKGFCSTDPNVVGICGLWNGPKIDYVACNGWESNICAESPLPRKNCCNCMFFNDCKEGDSLYNYCSSDPRVTGYCGLWDGPKYDRVACNGWVIKKESNLIM